MYISRLRMMGTGGVFGFATKRGQTKRAYDDQEKIKRRSYGVYVTGDDYQSGDVVCNQE